MREVISFWKTLFETYMNSPPNSIYFRQMTSVKKKYPNNNEINETIIKIKNIVIMPIF
jgi:hypothetical protein